MMADGRYVRTGTQLVTGLVASRPRSRAELASSPKTPDYLRSPKNIATVAMADERLGLGSINSIALSKSIPKAELI